MRRQQEHKPFNMEQERINRINKLLDRMDRIPNEMDVIHEKLFSTNGFSRDEFAMLVDRRTNLLHEQVRVEKELKEAYRMRFDA